MNAARLGVHRGAAAMCWVSFTPSDASRSMLGVLQTDSGVKGRWNGFLFPFVVTGQLCFHNVPDVYNTTTQRHGGTGPLLYCEQVKKTWYEWRRWDNWYVCVRTTYQGPTVTPPYGTVLKCQIKRRKNLKNRLRWTLKTREPTWWCRYRSSLRHQYPCRPPSSGQNWASWLPPPLWHHFLLPGAAGEGGTPTQGPFTQHTDTFRWHMWSVWTFTSSVIYSTSESTMKQRGNQQLVHLSSMSHFFLAEWQSQ